jgi:hypothetical protein
MLRKSSQSWTPPGRPPERKSPSSVLIGSSVKYPDDDQGMRLVGLRIGEAYGLFVSAYQGDGSRAWLRVETQGGKKSLARDKEGRFV